jgi:hypothetical protein
VPNRYRAALERAARELLRSLAGLPKPDAGVRVADAEGGLACLVLVWPAGGTMLTAAAERRRARGGRERCRSDIVEVVREAVRPLTCKEVVRALKSAGKEHGPGTVAKALADLTAAKELVNPKDKRGYRLPERWRREKTPSLFKND